MDMKAGPLTHQYAATSELKLHLRALHVLGLWPLRDSRLFRCLTATVIALNLGHIAEAAVNLITMDGGLEDYTLALSNVSVVVVGVLKVCFFLLHEHRYCRLVRRLDELVAGQREHWRGHPLREPLFRGAKSLILRVTVGFHVYDTSMLLAWMLTPLVASTGEKMLPFQQLPQMDSTAFPIYELSYALQVVSVLFIALTNFHIDCFFMGLMVHTATQLKILSSRITSLQQEEFQESETRDGVYDELCSCIQTHQEITRFVAHLETMMCPIATMQLALSVFNGCMLIFPAAYSSESGALVKCVSTVPTLSIQLLLYCMGAHSVFEQGEAVSLAAYNCDWPDFSPSCRRALLLVMTRAQMPLALTTGGIYPIQRGTFLSLLNAGYSCYAVLQNFNGL